MLTHSQSVIVIPELNERPLDVPFLAPTASPATSVGNNPNALPGLRQANEGSWYAVPLRIIPERGQVSEYSAQPSMKQVCDVLHDDEAGSYLANKSGVLSPQSASRSVDPSECAGTADVLTGKAPAYDVNGNSIGSKSLEGEGANVVINRNLGPVLCQYFAGEGFDLTEGDRLETAGPFQPEREAADAAEQVKDAQPARVSRHSPNGRDGNRLGA